MSASCYIALHASKTSGSSQQQQDSRSSHQAVNGYVRQAYSALYEWHARYTLSASAFDKVGAAKVLQTLRSFAHKEGVEQHIVFGTEVISVLEQPDGRCVCRQAYMGPGTLGSPPDLQLVCWHRFRLVCKDKASGTESAVTADAVLMCTGILGEDRQICLLASETCQPACLQYPTFFTDSLCVCIP